ncbi:MAG: hypothetical protein M1814_003341 [Vezdaea aestivalis]|nr:MAG: hypothetical protein M1814_003341 [Vezdaea aestivalis]
MASTRKEPQRHSDMAEDPPGENRFFTLDKILAERTVTIKGVVSQEYLAKWEGYPLADATWEPRTSFTDPKTMQEWKLRQRRMETGQIPRFNVQDYMDALAGSEPAQTGLVTTNSLVVPETTRKRSKQENLLRIQQQQNTPASPQSLQSLVNTGSRIEGRSRKKLQLDIPALERKEDTFNRRKVEPGNILDNWDKIPPPRKRKDTVSISNTGITLYKNLATKNRAFKRSKEEPAPLFEDVFPVNPAARPVAPKSPSPEPELVVESPINVEDHSSLDSLFESPPPTPHQPTKKARFSTDVQLDSPGTRFSTPSTISDLENGTKDLRMDTPPVIQSVVHLPAQAAVPDVPKVQKNRRSVPTPVTPNDVGPFVSDFGPSASREIEYKLNISVQQPRLNVDVWYITCYLLEYGRKSSADFLRRKLAGHFDAVLNFNRTIVTYSLDYEKLQQAQQIVKGFGDVCVAEEDGPSSKRSRYLLAVMQRAQCNFVYIKEDWAIILYPGKCAVSEPFTEERPPSYFGLFRYLILSPIPFPLRQDPQVDYTHLSIEDSPGSLFSDRWNTDSFKILFNLPFEKLSSENANFFLCFPPHHKSLENFLRDYLIIQTKNKCNIGFASTHWEGWARDTRSGTVFIHPDFTYWDKLSGLATLLTRRVRVIEITATFKNSSQLQGSEAYHMPVWQISVSSMFPDKTGAFMFTEMVLRNEPQHLAAIFVWYRGFFPKLSCLWQGYCPPNLKSRFWDIVLESIDSKQSEDQKAWIETYKVIDELCPDIKMEKKLKLSDSNKSEARTSMYLQPSDASPLYWEHEIPGYETFAQKSSTLLNSFRKYVFSRSKLLRQFMVIVAAEERDEVEQEAGEGPFMILTADQFIRQGIPLIEKYAKNGTFGY